MDSRIESHIVDPKMPPIEDGAVAAEPNERSSPRHRNNMWKVRRRQRTNRDGSRSLPGNYTNIFTSRFNNVSQGRGISLYNPTPRGL